MRFFVFISAVLFAPLLAEGRPVSYPGGWTLMNQNNWEFNRFHLHYSPTAKYSFGVSSEYLRKDKQRNFNLQWNRLIYRRNTPQSQANIYLKTEGGIAEQNGETEPNIVLRLSADWETRRYFTSYGLSERYSGDFDNGSFHQKVRLGIAPYVANYGSLHTWLMIQLEHHPERETSSELRVTPLVRLLKWEYLVELGVDDEEKILLNIVIRH